MIALGDFTPLDVSGDGSVIVGVDYDGSSGASAIFWDEANGLRGLEDVLQVDLGLDLTGWRLWDVTGVSADGTVIVGYGTNPLGRSEGWVAVIPEPSSLVLLTMGILTLVARRDRHGPRR